jgi:ABC-type amino acid transport substrate-binding protein
LTHYRIVTILQEPYVQNDGPSETFGFRGYCIDLLKILQKELNFTYELYLVPDKKFGRLDQTGIWSGMISELVSGQADIALGPISVTNERDVDVDFTRNYYYPVGTTILMRKKKPDYSLFKFVMVLEPKVWLCIFGCYLFISTLLWIFDRFSPYSYTNQRERHRNGDNVNEFSLFESLWFCVNSFTLQGFFNYKNTNSYFL